MIVYIILAGLYKDVRRGKLSVKLGEVRLYGKRRYIVHGHKVTHKGIDVDKANIEVIENYPRRYVLRVFKAS